MTARKLTLRSIGTDLRAAIEAAQDKKASDLVVLDLRGLASFTDFFFLATGNSNRQLKTIADAIEEGLSKKGVEPNHVEGYPRGDWILMDYVDFVVHVFTPPSREYYNLERLWGDAKRLAIAS
ncbi:MAG: ribosome silencing factor [Vicinamibacteria bacterium]